MASLSITALKDALDTDQTNPRVHPNGFVQFDLSEELRLHVWHHEIPRQKTNTPIHDHTFDMTSEVLNGRMVNINYEIMTEPLSRFVIHVPENGKLTPTEQQVGIDKNSVDVIWYGEEYSVPEGSFHESIAPHSAVTLIHMSPTQRSIPPRVLVPRTQKPDNSFDRYDAMTEDVWGIVRDVMSRNILTIAKVAMKHPEGYKERREWV